MNSTHFRPSALGLTFSALLFCATHALADPTIHGAGSTAAAPIYKTWAAEFQKSNHIEFVYDAIGSSAGVKKVTEKAADFGASDVAPPEADLAKRGLILLPMAITGITPVFNIPKIAEVPIHMNGEVLSRIFSGDIVRWNAPALLELNPRVALPDMPITVVVRSDGSGTTYNFTDYLSKVSPKWKADFGTKSTISWPAHFVAVEGSSGIVKAVKATPGAIGYVDYGYVKDNKLSAIVVKNAADEYVTPGPTSFKAALSASEWNSTGRFNATLTDQPGKGSWPITMGTFVLLPQVSTSPEQTQRALGFFVWAFMNGDRLVQSSNFVQLPSRVQAAAFKTISTIRDKSGTPIGLNLLGATGMLQGK